MVLTEKIIQIEIAAQIVLNRMTVVVIFVRLALVASCMDFEGYNYCPTAQELVFRSSEENEKNSLVPHFHTSCFTLRKFRSLSDGKEPSVYNDSHIRFN